MNERTSVKTGFAIWLTGRPSSGKSTLAAALADALAARGIQTQLLDSDEVRAILTPQPQYTEEERDWFYRVLVYMAQLLTQNGVNVILAATASRQAYRNHARKTITPFVEVYVYCSLEACRARDVKGLYAKAAAGAVKNVPGIQAPYEAPANPEVVIDTEQETVAESVQRITDYLRAASIV